MRKANYSIFILEAHWFLCVATISERKRYLDFVLLIIMQSETQYDYEHFQYAFPFKDAKSSVHLRGNYSH